jgi:hypothetical protein
LGKRMARQLGEEALSELNCYRQTHWLRIGRTSIQWVGPFASRPSQTNRRAVGREFDGMTIGSKL